VRALTVIRPGLLATVQDLGRPGHGRLGVSGCGAADPVALRLANRLAGNPEGAPAIEMTLVGGTFRLEAPAVVALAGAEGGADLDGEPLPPWVERGARAGQILSVGALRDGARAYLAVDGGIAVPLVLGSASTHLASGLGGLEGRPLRAGDLLPLGEPGPSGRAVGEPRPRRVDPAGMARLAPRAILRVTWGAQAEAFGDAARAAFLSGSYRVSEVSDRMGLRLAGCRLDPPGGGTMVTQGMPLGAVQVPPGGEPVILFVDHQTTGGYPVIASVISADLPLVGRLRPRDPVRFEAVSLERARALLVEQEAWIDSVSLAAR
jgi:biotin-dependent carboxylase-like uncharacterized protein